MPVDEGEVVELRCIRDMKGSGRFQLPNQVLPWLSAVAPNINLTFQDGLLHDGLEA